MRSETQGVRNERCRVALLMVLLCSRCAAAAPFSFDDIEYWVGEGSNRAAVVIDWDDNSAAPQALAWGYRWDGDALGSDMLLAVLTADDRLFAKLGGTPSMPAAVYGLGYDADGDGQFGVDDGTEFDEAGIAFMGPPDLGMATDAGDYYAEGWFSGFWHYGKADSNPYDGGMWVNDVGGMAGRDLSDGAWDSWVFTPTFDFSAYAENPSAAAAPVVTVDPLPGDYNGNGKVDAADYSVWRDAMTAQGNLSLNDPTPGTVDTEDFLYWCAHFGETSGSSAAYIGPGESPGANSAIVPEPAAGVLALVAFLTLSLTSLQPRKDND